MKYSVKGAKKFMKEYEKLKEKAKTNSDLNQLLEDIEKAIDDLKLNPELGIKIPKRLWPRYYIKEYDIDNLWKYNLNKKMEIDIYFNVPK